MAEVRVGDVRREKPGKERYAKLGYSAAPFRVVALVGLTGTRVCALDGRRHREKLLHDVEACPLWPSEHEQWKDARGYEVGT